MNKPLDRATLAAMGNAAIEELNSFFARNEAEKKKRHSAPYSKRNEGRQRRMERKAARRAKTAWLNS